MGVIVTTFALCIGSFAVIGLLSARKMQTTTEDYLVASRNVPAWLTALSSVATNNSGFMFIGLLGFTYRFGVQAVWLQTGWIMGDVLCWLFVHRKVREVSGRLGVASVPALLGTFDDGRRARGIIVLAGLLTFVFLAGYAAAQLNAGSYALHVLFGWDLAAGAIIGAFIVVLYCFAGGLRASIWTDAAQSFVMLGSMTALLSYAFAAVGGPDALFTQLESIDPSLIDWTPPDFRLGVGAYFIGFMFGGLGAIGQPHILIRSMAIRSAEDIPRARLVYFLWFVPFSTAAVLTGLYGRVLLPGLLDGVPAGETASAAEMALPALATLLLPKVLIGLLLAGVFAATMSTADSQVLSCSAAITQDVNPGWRTSYIASKIATVAVAAAALTVALWGPDSVFTLVLGSWSILGASLGPLLIMRVYGYEVPSLVGVAMMIAGIVAVRLWGASSYAGAVYELAPGMLASFAVFALARATRLVEGRARS